MSARGSDVSRAARRRDALRRRKQTAPLDTRPLRRRGRLIAVAAGLLLLALATGTARLFWLGYFDIQTVAVQGDSHLADETVRAAARIDGQNYFLADPAAAAARVRALPRVRDARVVTHFPHAATVTVSERVPSGIWQIGAVSYLIDDLGMVLDAPADPAALDGLPVVDATRLGDAIQIGDLVDPDPIRVAKALADQPPGTVGRQLARLEYDKQNGLIAVSDRGLVVDLGDGQDLDYKLAVWQATVATVPAADLHELDLRNQDRPFYR